MKFLFQILLWLLGGGVGLYLLGRFLDTISLHHQGDLYSNAKKFNRYIKKLPPLDFIFDKLELFARVERTFFGSGVLWWLQSVLLSMLIPGLGTIVLIALTPTASHPHTLQAWAIVAVMFGVLGAPPCWLACVTTRLVLIWLLKKRTWRALAGIIVIPTLVVPIISFLALVASALIYLVIIRWGFTIGFSVEDIRAVCDIEVIISILYAEVLLNISLLPAYSLIFAASLLAGLAGTAKYIENGFKLGNLTKKGERSFFTLVLGIGASWAVGVYLVVAVATYLSSVDEEFKSGEVQSLALIAKANLINTTDPRWKLYLIYTASSLKAFSTSMLYNQQALLDLMNNNVAQLDHALRKTVVFLPPGKAKGTYHFTFHSTVVTSDNGSASSTVTLRETSSGNEMLPQQVNSGGSFSITTDLLPGFYAVHSTVAAPSADKYLDAWGAFIKVYPNGREVVMLESRNITHELRIHVLAPDPNGEPTVMDDRPVLKWDPIPNAFIYVVDWGRYVPPLEVEITGEHFATKTPEATWPVNLDNGKKYEWIVTAFDVNGTEIAVSDPHRFFSTGGRNDFTTGQIATIPAGTPSLGLAIAKAKTGDQGIRVLGVNDLSPAQVAGIQAGDQITSLNGTALTADKPWELAVQVRKTSIGQTVKVGLLRDGKPLMLDVTVRAAP